MIKPLLHGNIQKNTSIILVLNILELYTVLVQVRFATSKRKLDI